MAPRGELIIDDDGVARGDVAAIRPHLGDSLDEMQRASRERLGAPEHGFHKFMRGVIALPTGIITAAVKLTAAVVGTVVGGIAGLFVKGLETLIGNKEALKEYQAAVRDELGNPPMPGSVLGGTVAMRNGTTVPIPMALEHHLQNLRPGCKVSTEDMLRYVAMGERIAHRLAEMPSDPKPTTLTVRGPNGQDYKIEPDVETTRALSWYLQAKALADNSGHGDGAFLKEGAMVAKDPGNKLYNFLRSSDNAYGRASTHMQERSDSRPSTWFSSISAAFRGGLAATFITGFKSQPVQYGIEDFDDRMPSKSGTLLFDKLKPSTLVDDTPEIYLKWESRGMPNTFSLTGTHSEGLLSDRLLKPIGAIGRCLGHARSHAANADPAGYRGEKMDKGEARQIMSAFQTAVRGLQNVSGADRERIVEHVKTYGAAEMENALMILLTSNVRLSDDERRSLEGIQTRLNTFTDNMGAFLGIARKGGEIHVRLPGAPEGPITVLGPRRDAPDERLDERRGPPRSGGGPALVVSSVAPSPRTHDSPF